jgi:hypothetical protein
MDGLRVLCNDLRVDWEELSGRTTKTGAALDIIDEFKRRHGLPSLLDYIKGQRPELFES